MTVANPQLENSITMKNEESEITCLINKLTTKRREQFNMKNPESMYFVVELSNTSFYKIKLKLDYCLCLLDQFDKQKSKSKHRVFMEQNDKYGLLRVKSQNLKSKGNSSKDSDEDNQHEFYTQKKSLPFGSYTKTSISRDFVNALNLEKDWHIGYSLNVIIDYKKFWPDLLYCHKIYHLSDFTPKEAMKILNEIGFQLKMEPDNMKSYLKSLANRSKLGLVKAMRELRNVVSFKK